MQGWGYFPLALSPPGQQAGLALPVGLSGRSLGGNGMSLYREVQAEGSSLGAGR